ncbi:MAG: bifunctional DNA-formamidopyrimidine glycosylase/DNA-(apurinic or apyrimidinic site) lyase [Acidimicrobiia bacterium]
MPELPEVEVLRRDLEAEVVGAGVEEVVVTGARTVRRQDPTVLVARLTGAVFSGAGRVGKYLLMGLDGGPETLVVHLRMSGQLILSDAGRPRAAHTHAVVRLSDGRELRFVDPRTFGELFVSREPPGPMGADPLDPGWRPAQLAGVMAGRQARLKALLMDQRRLAGLGNIYSDEALFVAGLRFDRPAGSLGRREVTRLHRAIVDTLAAAVAHRGSTLGDGGYVDLYGRPGAHQDHHRVYAREGRPCRRCARPVVRLRLGHRSTFLCEACQS